MSASDFSYDPTGMSELNLITGELHAVDLTQSCAVFPVNHSFFQDGLVVESKTGIDGAGADVYEELTEGTDYTFSPMFLNASAQTTGKPVFTYIVLLRNDITDLRLQYQTLGQYMDEVLLTEIAASTHDRTKPYAWTQLQGSLTNFAVEVREESLKGLSLVEVLYNKVSLIASALSQPKTNKLNLVLDMTRLEEKLYKKMDTANFDTVLHTPTAIIPLQAVSSEILHTVPADKNLTKAIVYFETTDGSEFLAMELMIVNGVEGRHSETNEQGTATVTLVTVKTGDETKVSITALKEGTVKIKVLSEI